MLTRKAPCRIPWVFPRTIWNSVSIPSSSTRTFHLKRLLITSDLTSTSSRRTSTSPVRRSSWLRTQRREYALRDALAKVRDRYSFILIDCPPSLGLLTINALVAADEILVPLQCEFLAVRGLDMLVDVVARVQRRLNPNLKLLGIVPTMYNQRRNHSQRVLERVRAAYPKKVLDVVIKESVQFAEAPQQRRTILEWDGKSEGAAAYRALAEVVLNARP